ncbi:MAG: acyl carrier protein [Pseudomonadota bacterium]
MNDISTPAARDEVSVRSIVRELVRELSPDYAGEEARSDQKLVDDLHYHSLALMELAFTLEDEFGLDPIDEQSVMNIVLVGDVENHVVSELKRKGLCA